MELLGVLFFFGLLVVVVFAFLGLARVQNGPPVEVENLIRRGFAQHNIVAHGRTIFGIKPNQEIFVQTNELRKSEIPISSIKKVDLTSRRYWNLHIIDVFTVSFGFSSVS
jgi:hypothetical protein